jgi:hypothetical protein
VVAALVGSILAEQWLFGRRMHQALVTDCGTTATANPGTPDQRRTGDR